VDILGLAAEKQHQGIVEGIEHFNKSGLKMTETKEKNPLPDRNSMSLVWLFVNVYMTEQHHKCPF